MGEAAAKKLAWKFRVSIAATSPKKFVVGDKGKQAEVVLKAFDSKIQGYSLSILWRPGDSNSHISFS